jgi:hypothetical protein
MENITINKLELASELANLKLQSEWRDSIQIFEDETASVTVYTEEHKTSSMSITMST